MKRKENHTFYNFQFKHTAVTITDHPNIQSIDVAEALNIHSIMLYWWRREMREGKLENNDQEARSRDKLLQAEKKIRKIEKELKQFRDKTAALKKAERIFPGIKVEAFRFIQKHAKRCSVAVLCRRFWATRGGYYAWLRRGRSQRQVDNAELLEKIVELHQECQERNGSPRVHQSPQQMGIVCGRNRVARTMRVNGIAAKMARQFRRHSHRHELFRGSTNLLLGRESTTGPNQVWVGDITFIRVRDKWPYLNTVLDRHTRQIIDWSFTKDRSADLVREALFMATHSHAPTT